MSCPSMIVSTHRCMLLLVLMTSCSVSRALVVGSYFIGFDLGTSGARISVVQEDKLDEVFADSIRWEAYDDPSSWEDAVYTLLRNAKDALGTLQLVRSICVSGTSASCLMVDATGKVTRQPRMYDYDVVANNPIVGHEALQLLAKYAPLQHTTRAKTSSLIKLLTWALERKLEDGEVLCHQSDFIAMKLMTEKGLPRPQISSDWHNCLKCGYDVKSLKWPGWVEACLQDAGIEDPLGKGIVPEVLVSPGQPLGFISTHLAQDFDFSPDTVLVGGTTDSNAAFFAAAGGVQSPVGTAVTSLGSTLAIKQLSQTYVEDASRGVYSHRFPNFQGDGQEVWLIGGASNVGCAVLRQQGFSDQELVTLSEQIDPMSDIDLLYYPLVKKGERFPIADGDKQPVMEPVPDSRKDFLHGILQAISNVEKDGFRLLGELGASPSQPVIVKTCGGGSKNDMWTKMRERLLRASFKNDDLTVERADKTEASFGAAILASATFR